VSGSTASFVFYSDTGSKIMEVGSQSQFGDRGLVVYRNDGSEAIRVARFADSVPDQVLQLKDRGGNVIFQDDYVTGNGVNWPKLPVTFYPVTTVFEATTTSTTFVNLFRARPRYQNPNMRLVLQAFTTGATVQGQIQLKDSFFGQYGQLVTHASGATQGEYVFVEQIVPFGTVGDERDMFITGRISAGAGTLTVRLISALGE
jgi:hypothetical protein